MRPLLDDPKELLTLSVPTVELGLESFLEREHPRLVRTLSSYTGNRDLAEELAAEALARMVRNWERVGAMEAPGAYAHRTAINLANSWFRRQAAHRRALTRRGPESRHHTDPDTATSIAVRDAVSSLPKRQRAVVALYYLAGFSTAEVASLLDVAAGTVRSELHHARRSLRESLGEEAHVEPRDVEPVVPLEDVRARAEQLGRRRTAATTVAVLLVAVAVVGGVLTLVDSARPQIVDEPEPAPRVSPETSDDAIEVAACAEADTSAAEDLDQDGDPDPPGPVSCGYPWTAADMQWVFDELDEGVESGALASESADALRRQFEDAITDPDAWGGATGYGVEPVPLIGADGRALRILALDGTQTVIPIDNELDAAATVGEIDVRPGSTPDDSVMAVENRTEGNTTVRFVRLTGEEVALIGGTVETDGPLTAVRWSPDGQAIVWSTMDGAVGWTLLGEDLELLRQGDFPALTGPGATVLDWEVPYSVEGSDDWKLKVAYGSATGPWTLATTDQSSDGELTAAVAAESIGATILVGDPETEPAIISLSRSGGDVNLNWRHWGREGVFVLPNAVRSQDAGAQSSYRIDAHAGSVLLRTPEMTTWWPNPDKPIVLGTDRIAWTPIG